MGVSRIPTRRVLHALSLVIAVAAIGCGSADTNVVAPSDNKCEISVTSNPAEIPAGGGTGTLTITTSRDCSWTASTGASWISLAATRGQGPAAVEFTAAANPSGTPRRTGIVVAQQTVDITQAATPCRFAASPPAVNVDASEHQLSIVVTAPDGCRWSGRSDVTWIATPAPADGTGSATVRAMVAPNTAQAARAGTVTIGDATVRVSQSGRAEPAPPPAAPPPPSVPTPTPACSYRLEPTSRTVGRGPDEFAVAVTAPPGCSWTVSSGASWVTVVGDQTRSGSGTVRLAVAANPGDARTAAVRIATETFTIRQAGGTCSYSIAPTSYHAGRGPEEIRIAVATDAGCTWTATSPVSWVTVKGNDTGSGNGTVELHVDGNKKSPRLATLTIAGQPFELRQDGK